MNCQDFEQLWNRLLETHQADPVAWETDKESTEPTFGTQDLVQSLRDHAFLCPECKDRMRAFETLHYAIRRWEHAPKATPSDDLVDRIIWAASNTDVSSNALRNRSLWIRGWMAGLATTAAVALAMTLHLAADRSRLNRRVRELDPIPPQGQTVTRPTTPVDLFVFNQALTDASDATWDLAYTASAPAVRLGRHFFNDTGRTNPIPTAPEGRADKGILSTETPGDVVSEALNQFGEGISAGVRPLSNSARRALKFLQRPDQQTDGMLELPASQPDSKGA